MGERAYVFFQNVKIKCQVLNAWTWLKKIINFNLKFMFVYLIKKTSLVDNLSSSNCFQIDFSIPPLFKTLPFVAGCCWLSWMDCPLWCIQVISWRGVYPPPPSTTKIKICRFHSHWSMIIICSMILSLFLQRTRMNLFTSIWNDRNLWSSCEDLVRWGMATKIRVTLHDCAISVSIKFHKRKNCHWHVIVCFCLISVLIHFSYFCFIIIIVSKFQYSWYMFLNLNLRKNCTVKRKIYTEKMWLKLIVILKFSSSG